MLLTLAGERMSQDPALPPGAAPDKPLSPAARRALEEAAARRAAEHAAALPTEEGGRDGPEPTRFGDWERKGVAVDF
ncbi:dihydrodipicolinate reductase [Caulobacter sp. Root487D2Y]|nr:dihydrodipicolinate reductase [Caulobacter sp. Root487D2Y]